MGSGAGGIGTFAFRRRARRSVREYAMGTALSLSLHGARGADAVAFVLVTAGLDIDRTIS